MYGTQAPLYTTDALESFTVSPTANASTTMFVPVEAVCFVPVATTRMVWLPADSPAFAYSGTWCTVPGS